uniref:Putative ovule protein n=1 Tax=Solanum chacoense TaxID=4108 RepID=A0A0V0GLL7_SOLCH
MSFFESFNSPEPEICRLLNKQPARPHKLCCFSVPNLSYTLKTSLISYSTYFINSLSSSLFSIFWRNSSLITSIAAAQP